MSSEYSKYTYTLDELAQDNWKILTDAGLPIPFTNFDYSIIEGYDNTSIFDKDFLEELWFRHYRFREIGAETLTRWSYYVDDLWHELAYKYQHLFKTFNDKYNSEDVIDNNKLSVERGILYQDTPQTAIIDDDRYATSKTKESTELNGRTLTKPKYELLAKYEESRRYPYMEWIKDSEPLFMQLF